MTEPHKKPLRQAMPTVAGWIDDLRAAFGADMIDAAVRAGIAGQKTFHAIENGHEVGTPIPYNPTKAVRLSDIGWAPPTHPKETR